MTDPEKSYLFEVSGSDVELIKQQIANIPVGDHITRFRLEIETDGTPIFDTKEANQEANQADEQEADLNDNQDPTAALLDSDSDTDEQQQEYENLRPVEDYPLSPDTAKWKVMSVLYSVNEPLSVSLIYELIDCVEDWEITKSSVSSYCSELPNDGMIEKRQPGPDQHQNAMLWKITPYGRDVVEFTNNNTPGHNLLNSENVARLYRKGLEAAPKQNMDLSDWLHQNSMARLDKPA